MPGTSVSADVQDVQRRGQGVLQDLPGVFAEGNIVIQQSYYSILQATYK